MRKMFAALAAVPFVLSLMSSTASAAEEAIETYQNVATGACVDDSWEYGLRGASCNYDVWQQWTVIDLGSNVRQFRSRATGQCLSDDSYTLSTETCTNSEYQRWYVYSSNSVVFQSLYTRECLDDSSWGLRTVPCTTNNSHQRFK
jgi:hypothetical protein